MAYIEVAGLTLGDGTNYVIEDIEGLGSPAVRSADVVGADRHGETPGVDLYEPRTVGIIGDVLGDIDGIDTVMTPLQAAFVGGGTEAPVRFQIPGIAGGGVRRINARPKSFVTSADRRIRQSIPRFAAELKATDPRIYDDVETTVQTVLASTSGGVSFPVTFPAVFGQTTSGVIGVTNEGNFATGARFIMTGPVVNPTIVNLTTGDELGLNLDVPDGSFVVIDTAADTVLLNGTASRIGSLQIGATLFDLPPGETQLRYSAAGDTASVLTVQFRSAWIA